MDAEDLALNDGSDSEIIEDLGAVFPWVSVSVLSNGLIVESVHCCDLSSFVISSQNCYSISPSDFYRDKKSHTFD